MTDQPDALTSLADQIAFTLVEHEMLAGEAKKASAVIRGALAGARPFSVCGDQAVVAERTLALIERNVIAHQHSIEQVAELAHEAGPERARVWLEAAADNDLPF